MVRLWANTSAVTQFLPADLASFIPKVRDEHAEEGIRAFANCVECHRSFDEEPLQRGGRDRRARD